MITQTINHLIDHTKLDINASPDSLLVLAKEAVAYRFNSICIRPAFIKNLAPIYRCSAVISFPENKISYDPEKDKRFTGSIRLPVAPKPKMNIAVIGTAAHCM